MNPFRAKAGAARARYNRLSGTTAHDAAMAQSFPLGAGYGRKGDDRRLEATITRATNAVQTLSDARYLEAQANAFDAGKINAQGRSINPESIARSVKREAQADKRAARKQAAMDLRGDRPAWAVASSLYADSTGYFVGSLRALMLDDHHRYVERALAEGLSVPADVLAEYPDLAGGVRA